MKTELTPELNILSESIRLLLYDLVKKSYEEIESEKNMICIGEGVVSALQNSEYFKIAGLYTQSEIDAVRSEGAELGWDKAVKESTKRAGMHCSSVASLLNVSGQKNHIKQQFLSLLGEAKEDSKWIPVSEREPESKDLVNGAVWAWHKRLGFGAKVNHAFIFKNGDYSHWQPLPPSPNK